MEELGFRPRPPTALKQDQPANETTMHTCFMACRMQCTHMGEDYVPCHWGQGQYQGWLEEETRAGGSPHLLFPWTEGPTWGCCGFQNARVGAAAGLGRVGAGAEGGRGGDGLLGRALWFLHLLRAQVDFDGPLRALQVYLQVLLEEEEKPGHGSGQLDTYSGVSVHGRTHVAPTIHESKLKS